MDSVPLTVQRPPRSIRARLLRWGVMSIIFGAGGVAGYCVGTMQLLDRVTPATSVAKEPNKFVQFLLAHIKKDLNLTEAQYPEVEKIVLQHHEAFDKIRRDTQPLFEREMAKMDRDMLAVLTEPQGELWKTRMKRMGAPWRGGRPGGGPPRSDRDGKRGSEHKPHDHKNHDHKNSEPSGEKPKPPNSGDPEIRAKLPDAN